MYATLSHRAFEFWMHQHVICPPLHLMKEAAASCWMCIVAPPTIAYYCDVAPPTIAYYCDIAPPTIACRHNSRLLLHRLLLPTIVAPPTFAYYCGTAYSISCSVPLLKTTSCTPLHLLGPIQRLLCTLVMAFLSITKAYLWKVCSLLCALTKLCQVIYTVGESYQMQSWYGCVFLRTDLKI